MDWTFVTGFLDIRDYDKDYSVSVRTPEEYLSNSDFIFKFDIPIICFCDSKFVDIIREKRKSFSSQTQVYPYSFSDLPKLKYLQILQEERRKVCQMPNKYSGGYYLLVNSKLDFMKKAIELNPFSSSYFAWIDFGLSYLCSVHQEFPKDIQSLKPNKISLMSINRVNENEVEDDESMEKFLQKISWETSAQFWFGPKDEILWFRKEFDNLYDNLISKKIIVLEEKLFSVIAAKNRQKFKNWIGRYVDSLKNSYRPRGSFDLILNRIRIEQNIKKHKEAFRIAKYLLLSRSEMKNEEVFDCLDFILINGYYINKKDEARNAAKEMIELAKNDIELRKKMESNYDYYFNNFQFYKEDPTIELVMDNFTNIQTSNKSQIIQISVKNGLPDNIIESLQLSNPRFIKYPA